jgi:hypothetical protein
MCYLDAEEEVGAFGLSLRQQLALSLPLLQHLFLRCVDRRRLVVAAVAGVEWIL